MTGVTSTPSIGGCLGGQSNLFFPEKRFSPLYCLKAIEFPKHEFDFAVLVSKGSLNNDKSVAHVFAYKPIKGTRCSLTLHWSVFMPFGGGHLSFSCWILISAFGSMPKLDWGLF